MDAMTLFLDNLERARLALDAIEQHVDDHMNFDPENIHHGHAGDAGRLAAMLTEICETFNLRRD